MKEKIYSYFLVSLFVCFSFLSCTDEETESGDDFIKPEQLIIGFWQLIACSTSEGMVSVEDGEIIEFTSDGKVFFENASAAVFRFDVDKLCLIEPLTEEPYIIYTYEFEEDRLQLEMFSTTIPSEETNSLPNLLVYQRIEEL